MLVSTLSRNRAIALTVGESIFVNSLLKEVPKYTSAVPAQLVVDVGATSLSSLTTVPSVLEALRTAYAKSFSNTMYFSLAIACLAVPTACAMEWLNVKKVAAERQLAGLTGTFHHADGAEEGKAIASSEVHLVEKEVQS